MSKIIKNRLNLGWLTGPIHKWLPSILSLVLLCCTLPSVVQAETSSEFSANQEANFEVGIDGSEVSLNTSIAGELAGAINGSLGDDQLGVDAELQARVEYMAGLEARAGVWMDDNGITIGAEATAGAYVEASVEASFTARIFGIEASVNAYASGSAGIIAEASASITLGYDGTISFELGAGVSVGLGFSVGVGFSLDIAGLMDAFNLADIDDLLEWIDEFIADPERMVGDLISDATGAVIDHTTAAVVDHATDFVVDTAGNIANGLSDWLGLGGDQDDDVYIPDPDDDAYEDITILPIEPSAPGGSTKAYKSRPEFEKYR